VTMYFQDRTHGIDESLNGHGFEDLQNSGDVDLNETALLSQEGSVIALQAL